MPFYTGKMIIYLDTETTGLHPGNICQLSYIIQEDEVLRAKNMFFKVDGMEYGAFKVHGFSLERLNELSCGKRFADRIDEVNTDFQSADMVVAHNTSFDFMFLSKEFENCGKFFSVKDSFCSMKKMTPICKIPRNSNTGYKYPKLSELCGFFSVTDDDILRESKSVFGEETNYHDARFDCTAVYLAMTKAVENGFIAGELWNKKR